MQSKRRVMFSGKERQNRSLCIRVCIAVSAIVLVATVGVAATIGNLIIPEKIKDVRPRIETDSDITSIAYDEETRVLTIRLADGNTLKHEGVPLAIHKNLLRARARYYEINIQDAFPSSQ